MRPPLPQLHALVMDCLTDFPDARFITDTQLLLDPVMSTVLNIETLLSLLDDVPDPYHHEVVDQFVGALTRNLTALPAAMARLDRRQILGSVTRLIYPGAGLPPIHTPQALAPGLTTAWALAMGDTLAVVPAEQLTAHVGVDELDHASQARIRAYARGVQSERAVGGVLLSGGRQTTSVALYIDACARAVSLRRSSHGYFVAVPDRSHCIIVPATEVGSLGPMIGLSSRIFRASEQKFSPFIYHWVKGRWHGLVTESGLTPTPELLALHGPVDRWHPFADFVDDDAA